MQEPCKLVQVTALEACLYVNRYLLDIMQRLQHGPILVFSGLALVFQNGGRFTRTAGKEEHQTFLQRLPHIVRNFDGFDDDPVAAECDLIQTTKG